LEISGSAANKRNNQQMYRQNKSAPSQNLRVD